MKGPETQKNDKFRQENGFYIKYMSGNGLDIGYRGSVKDAEPVLPTAIGIELDYPGYDGITLPFPDNSQDYVYSSHTLEHITDYRKTLQDWFRVVKVGGYIVITVPHMYLYERKWDIPSIWNKGHKRFYNPSELLREIEESLLPNSYRIVHYRDNDDRYNYSIEPPAHPSGNYEIECVIKKINPPRWGIQHDNP